MPHLRSAFDHPWILGLLLVTPALGLFDLFAAWRRRRALARLGNVGALLPERGRFRWVANLCASTGLTAVVAGAAGPHWGQDPMPPTVPGRDLVIVLDMSNSMRATDAPPTRFDRSREALRQLAAYAKQVGGHRLALVAFAADARLVCPLTRDYDHFRTAVDSLELDHPPPGLRPTGNVPSGTRIGAGLRAAVAAHDPDAAGFQDVIVLSDGDDPLGDREWFQAAQAVRAAGIPFHTVGVGDPDRDTPIHVPGYPAARTRLHEGPLQEIARQTGGSYVPARRDPPGLVEFFRQRIEPKGGRPDDGDPVPLPKPRHVWFYATGLCLLAAAWLGKVL